MTIRGVNMYECPQCGHKMDEDDKQFDCPYCGREDYGEGYYECENCGTLFDWQGDMWECPYCENNGDEAEEVIYDVCPQCGALIDDEVCDECGWPEVNQDGLENSTVRR